MYEWANSYHNLMYTLLVIHELFLMLVQLHIDSKKSL